ncbi:MAG: hypothetical protein AB7E13_04805 [Arcobacteraceae bacterium]
MIKSIGLCSLMFVSCINVYALDKKDETLLSAFHKYNITKCDKFILKDSKLVANWNYNISRYSKDIANGIYEASVIIVDGSTNDTIKVDHSYMQTPNGCFVTKRSTLTFSGSCNSNIDGNYWYLSNAIPENDYSIYKNKYNLEMYAKEILLGNFKACVQEISIRETSPLEK